MQKTWENTGQHHTLIYFHGLLSMCSLFELATLGRYTQLLDKPNVSAFGRRLSSKMGGFDVSRGWSFTNMAPNFVASNCLNRPFLLV